MKKVLLLVLLGSLISATTFAAEKEEVPGDSNGLQLGFDGGYSSPKGHDYHGRYEDGLDVLHGHYTISPIPLAEACAFDPDLWERTAKASVAETIRAGITLTFAPMLDVSRDPRWGRIAEGPGEDALVASRYAEAKVRGFQGSDLSARENIAACAKHLGA